MATMNVSVPDPMKDWVQIQIESGTYSNASDYIRDLIRRDQRQQEKLQALQNAIDEGVQSGISTESLDDVLAAAKKRARKCDETIKVKTSRSGSD